MKFSAVMFDLDGTLLDTLEDLAVSMNTALAQEGFPEHPVDAYRMFVGKGVQVLVEKALPQDICDEEIISRCADRMRAEYREHYADTTEPYPGIPDMLGALEKMHIPKAVFSNKPDEFTKECVNRFLSGYSFAAVRGALDSIPPKPDPAGAFAIAESMNIPAEEFLYVGDSDTDMHTARAAGMFGCGVTWGFRTEQELRNSGACRIIHEPGEIIYV